MLRRVAIFMLLALSLALGAHPAEGEPPIVCPPGSEPDPRGGICIITVTNPGGGGRGDGGGGGTSHPAPPRPCTFTLGQKPNVVPCSGHGGWWSQTHQA